MPRGGPRGDEIGPGAHGHGPHEVLDVHLQERGALNVAAGDQVEAHVHRAALIDHGPYAIVDRSVVESVDHRHVRSPAVRVDLGGDAVEGLTGSPGEKHRGSLAGEASATSRPIPPAAP